MWGLKFRCIVSGLIALRLHLCSRHEIHRRCGAPPTGGHCCPTRARTSPPWRSRSAPGRLLDLPLTLPVAGGVLARVGLSRGFIGRRWPIQWWMENTGSPDFFTKTSFQLVSLRWHMRVAAMAVKARKCSGLRS